MTSLTTFIVVQFWICLAAVLSGPVTCYGKSGDGDGRLNNVNVNTVKQWIKELGPSWWSAWKTLQDHRKEKEKTKAAVLPSTVASKPILNIFDGFFGMKDRRRPVYKATTATQRRHETNRPKNEENATVGHGVRNATTADRAVFGTEDVCVSANNGRPCMCHMIEFLNSIGKRLDEMAAEDQTPVATAFRCSSYRPVPASFAVNTTTNTAVAPINETTTPINMLGQKDVDNSTANDRVPREVDFDNVVDYELETSKDDHYVVHYSFVGSDVKLRCFINSDGNDTEKKSYKWDYTKPKNNTNSTVVGTNMNDLLILNLNPRDSKNYTCLSNASTVGNSTNDKPYKHYVIAVENPNYEIHGTAYYKSNNSGGCTSGIVANVRTNLSDSIRSEMCPEGSSKYACNVEVETAKCLEEEMGTLEIKYLVTLNENASYLTRIKTSKKGQDALYHQKLLATISKVLVVNLRKSLTVQLTSEMSPIYTHFDPDDSRTKINKYVSCSPGFGIREVFCAACPPHHYSPDKRANCLRCPKGFHQSNAGSKICVKCPSIYSSGCYISEVPHVFYYIFGLVLLSVTLIVVISCWCCYRDENETNMKILPRGIRKKLNRTKGFNLSSDDESSTLSLNKILKKIIKNRRKSKKQDLNSKVKFKNIHNEFNQDLQIP